MWTAPKELLDFHLAEAESGRAWTSFPTGFKRRCLQEEGSRLVTTDGGPGLVTAVERWISPVLRQGCIAHGIDPGTQCPHTESP